MRTITQNNIISYLSLGGDWWIWRVKMYQDRPNLLIQNCNTNLQDSWICSREIGAIPRSDGRKANALGTRSWSQQIWSWGKRKAVFWLIYLCLDRTVMIEATKCPTPSRNEWRKLPYLLAAFSGRPKGSAPFGVIGHKGARQGSGTTNPAVLGDLPFIQ